MNDEMQYKDIVVKGISRDTMANGGFRTTITVEGQGGKDFRLSFFDKKQDGTYTKAQQDFDSVRPLVGDTLNVGITSRQYVDSKGVERTGYNIRTISVPRTQSSTPPARPAPPTQITGGPVHVPQVYPQQGNTMPVSPITFNQDPKRDFLTGQPLDTNPDIMVSDIPF